MNTEILQKSTNSEGPLKGFMQLGPGKWSVSETFPNYAEKLRNFEVRPDDVWITGIPRSGTTLTEDMVWLMLNGVDLERFRDLQPGERVQFFESTACHEKLPDEVPIRVRILEDSYTVSENMLFPTSKVEGRRVIKTHLPFCLLPPEVLGGKCKIIYVARTPQDVIVSSYHYYTNYTHYMGQLVNNFEEFFDFYIKDLMPYTPYWGHIEQAWEKRHLPQLRFVFYEDTIRDIPKAVEEVSRFLEANLKVDERERLEGVLDFEEFKSIKKARSEEPEKDFVRKGKIGGFKDYMSEEVMERAEKWVKENTRRIGIEYPAVE